MSFETNPVVFAILAFFYTFTVAFAILTLKMKIKPVWRGLSFLVAIFCLIVAWYLEPFETFRFTFTFLLLSVQASVSLIIKIHDYERKKEPWVKYAVKTIALFCLCAVVFQVTLTVLFDHLYK